MRALVVPSLAALFVASLLLPTPARAGDLDLVDVQQDAQGGVEGIRGVIAVAVSHDGRHLYAAGESNEALAVFERDAASGVLTQVDVMRNGFGGVDGLEHVSDVAVSPDDAHVYAVSTTQNAVTAFSRDKTSGRLAFIEAERDGRGGVDGLEFARVVVVSPDGKNVYVAGQRAGAVVVFKRDTFSGALEYVQTVRDGTDGVDGLKGVVSLAFGPEGRQLYAAGMSDGAVTLLRRNADGTLTFIEALKDDPKDPKFGILGTAGVAVSPDGKNVYVTGQIDDSLAVFARNASSGRLRFVSVYAQGMDDADGLYGALAVTVNPKGTRLFTTGLYDGTVSAFARDPKTGALTFLERHKNMEGPTTCLAMARGLALSPDAHYLYVAGASSSAVNAFRVSQ